MAERVSNKQNLNKLPVSANDLKTIRWFVRNYVRRERIRFLLVAVLLGVSAATTAGLAWLIKPAFDGAIIGQNTDLLWLLPLGIVALVTINGIALFGSAVIKTTIEQNLTNRIQTDFVGGLLRADTAYLDQRHTGQLIIQCTAFPGQVVMAITRFVTALAGDIAMVTLLIGVMFLRDWQLASVSLVVVPIIALGIRLINQPVRARAITNMEIMGRVGARLADILNGIRLIKLHTAEEWETNQFAKLLDERRRAMLALARARSAASPIFEIAGGVGIGLVFFYAAVRASTGGPSFGTLASMMGALIMAYRPLKRIAATVATVQESLVVARGLKQGLEYEPLIVDRPGARELDIRAGAIRFDNVWFGYQPDRDVINGISLEITPGQMTALVGPSGGGKTTLLNLVSRLYDIRQGRVLIDNTDIRDVTLTSLRRAIAVVSQDTVLFDDTVRANIAYGRPDVTEDQIIAAAESANASAFIADLPNGFDTVIGERGVRLSGGERQRLAIARAVLKDAPILLLDEATSSVDSESEHLIQAAIWKLMQGRTVVLVAHRLSTVVGADRIYVINNGRIEESGIHNEMVHRGGLYARLYSIQPVEQGEWAN